MEYIAHDMSSGSLSLHATDPRLHLCHIFHISHSIDIIFVEYDSLSRCLDGEMVDM
jgi:hypothetical protein